MGVDIIHTDPISGQMYAIDSTHMELAKRIQQGDATVGWHGDPSLFVIWHPQSELFLIYKKLSEDQAVLVMDVSPDAWDTRVLRRLSEADTRFHDVMTEVEMQNASIDRDVAREDAALEEEFTDIRNFIARKYATGGDEFTRQEAKWVMKDKREVTSE